MNINRNNPNINTDWKNNKIENDSKTYIADKTGKQQKQDIQKIADKSLIDNGNIDEIPANSTPKTFNKWPVNKQIQNVAGKALRTPEEQVVEQTAPKHPAFREQVQGATAPQAQMKEHPAFREQVQGANVNLLERRKLDLGKLTYSQLQKLMDEKLTDFEKNTRILEKVAGQDPKKVRAESLLPFTYANLMLKEMKGALQIITGMEGKKVDVTTLRKEIANAYPTVLIDRIAQYEYIMDRMLKIGQTITNYQKEDGWPTN